MKFHSFYTNDIPYKIVEDHRKCCDKNGIDIIYHQVDQSDVPDAIYTAHGDFMTNQLINSNDDMVCFIDIDCLPHNGKILKDLYDWAKTNESFVGNAQNISHTIMRNRIYAAASTLMISRRAWERLGKPSFSWYVNNLGHQIDTAQHITLKADELGIPYQLMYPEGFDEGKGWQLGGYGKYGTGTLYPATWHYFRLSSLYGKIPDLWNQRVDEILSGQEIKPHYPSLPYGVSNWRIKLDISFKRFKKRWFNV
jgi:hypothetical protein